MASEELSYEEFRDQLLRDQLAASGSGSGSFAPPMTVMPNITVTPRPTAAPTPAPPSRLPTPNLPSRIAAAALRVGARLGGGVLALLTPMNSGEEGTGNLFGGPGALYPDGPPPSPAIPLPEPEADLDVELEPIIVTPAPPPAPPPVNVPIGEDPIMPPNWNDLSNPEGVNFDKPTGPGIPVLIVPDFDDPADRRAPEPPSDPGELPLPAGPQVFPEPLPGDAASDQPLPDAAPVLPSPLPYSDPFGFGPALFDPLPSTRPGTSARPGGRPATRPRPRSPLNPAIPGIPDGYRPSVPGFDVGLPDFFTSPTPDIQDDPIPEGAFGEDAPGQDEQCDCAPKKKKKKKKAKERTVCKQGTYTQRAKGIKYAPRRTVPCESAPEPERKKKSSKPTTRRPRPGQFPTSITEF